MDFAPSLSELGLCPFALMTGKPCVLCGGTRAALALLNGDLERAIQMNMFVTIFLPASFVALLFIWLFRWRRGHGASLLYFFNRPNFFGTLAIAWLLVAGWVWNLQRW